MLSQTARQAIVGGAIAATVSTVKLNSFAEGCSKVTEKESNPQSSDYNADSLTPYPLGHQALTRAPKGTCE